MASHDKKCRCRECMSTGKTGRGGREIKMSRKERQRAEKFGQQHEKRNQPTQRARFFGL